MYKYHSKNINTFLANDDSKDKLFSLASLHNLSELENFITTNSISLNVKNDNNQTVMHVLLEAESITYENELLRCIKFLVERGAPVSSPDKSNLTPLFICIKKNYQLIFNYLLENGASLDINTYDNLTVLHVLSQPVHRTYDEKGIQNISPLKLPKIDSKEYENNYKLIADQIDALIRTDLNFSTRIEVFKKIAEQFYVHDNKTEDFNNVLLKDRLGYENVQDKKKELFEKIQNNLDRFYNSEQIQDMEETKLNDKFNTIKKKLNEHTKKQTMLDLNDNVLNAIKSLAYSLELRTHFFFVDELGRSHVATNVVIAIATRVVNAAAANAAAADVNTAFSNANTNAIRAALQAVEAANTVLAEKNIFKQEINEAIINVIKDSVVAHIAAGGVLTAVTVHGIFGAAAVAAVQTAMVPNAGGVGPAFIAALPKAQSLIDAVRAAINTAGPTLLETNIQAAVNDPVVNGQIVFVANQVSQAVTTVSNIQTHARDANQAVPAADQVAAKAVVQAAIRAAAYATAYSRIQINNIILLPSKPAIMSAVHAAVQTAVLTAVSAEEQTALQTALKDPVVAVEAVLAAAKETSAAILAAAAPDDVVLAAVKEALALPQIIPDILKNQDYNELIKSYKLMNIPQQYFNYNISYQYNNSSVTSLDNNLVKFIENNTKPTGPLINYKLPDGNRTHTIDFFNLLHTFNEYARNNYNPQVIDDDIFILYQNIQQIYKYNYIIYIFQKQKDRILQFKDHVNTYTALKTNLDTVFDSNLQELEKSINYIKQKLKEIQKIANEYIDIYNKRNGFQKYKKDDDNRVTKYIGIYPKIRIPEISESTDFTTLQEEYAIIAGCNNYFEYNKHKDVFFHNLVLYFQDIGVYDNAVAPINTLLNRIPKLMYYNIDVINNHKINNDDDSKKKAYKLYFYDPTYLKLEKQNIIQYIIPRINDINIIITDTDKQFNDEIKNTIKTNYKNKILNQILNVKFNEFLETKINNFFIIEMLDTPVPIVIQNEIIPPDINSIILQTLGFSSILIPNYEFQNNKFIYISKNRFLQFLLYFDTNYFKPIVLSTFNTLEYYEDNKCIKELLKKKQSLLLKTDIKGWTPIYYAIDGNNYDVIKLILNVKNINTLLHYDHKQISPLLLCINKQLNHLNYLLSERNRIHYLTNYQEMLKNELKNNNILVPLNINAVFVISLFIQNHIWSGNAGLNLQDLDDDDNNRKVQINNEYNTHRGIYIDSHRIDDTFNNYDNVIQNDLEDNLENNRIDYVDKDYDYNYIPPENNIIIRTYYEKARQLESQDMGSYGTYWNKNLNKINRDILVHIEKSKELKNILNILKDKEKTDTKFNLPLYEYDELKPRIDKLNSIKGALDKYLRFINIRFNNNKKNAYKTHLEKIYVHVLANIIGVHFYLKMEQLIVTHLINNNNTENTIRNISSLILKELRDFLINNNLDSTNINFMYISESKNPELILKDRIIEKLQKLRIPNNEELVQRFKTDVYPNYKDLYSITYKYLQMFILNYHKFIYNQYHGLEILLLLLNKLK